jgi:hypothetical protein
LKGKRNRTSIVKVGRGFAGRRWRKKSVAKNGTTYRLGISHLHATCTANTSHTSSNKHSLARSATCCRDAAYWTFAASFTRKKAKLDKSETANTAVGPCIYFQRVESHCPYPFLAEQEKNMRTRRDPLEFGMITLVSVSHHSWTPEVFPAAETLGISKPTTQ